MRGAGKRDGTGVKRGQSPEPRIGKVTFNTGPDAEDRLSRLFTLLLSLANEARERKEGKDTQSGNDA